MRFKFALLTLSLLLTGCGRHLSDAAISRKAPGNWTDTSNAGASIGLRQDGSFCVTSAQGDPQFGGSWLVKDQFLVLNVTNIPHATIRFKIVSVNDHQMVIRPNESQTNVMIMSKK
jgi:hypothetical protein